MLHIRVLERATISLFFLLLFTSPLYADQQFELVREIGDPAVKPPQRLLNEPRALALAGGRVFIADTDAHRVVVLDQEGKTVLTWGKKGDQSGHFRSPSGIAVDEQGSVYVVDAGNGRVQVFDGDGTFLRSFGSRGSGPKQFNDPGGISVFQGRVHVADRGNRRVQVLTTGGIFLSQITFSVKKDDMKAPVDVAADLQGRIYVLDAGANKVRVFDAAGAPVLSFGSSGKGTEGFDKPRGIAVDDRGNIYVADTGNCKIKKFDAKGKLLGSVGSEGMGPGQFKEPSGIKVDREGTIHLLDSGKHTLQTFTSDVGDEPRLSPVSPPQSVALLRQIAGEVTALAVDKQLWGLSGDSIVAVGVVSGKTIAKRGSEPGMLRNPRGLLPDGTGNLWVADTGNDRLQRFSPEGDLLQVIGRPGSRERELSSPSCVALTRKGNLVVADTGNRRVQIFSAKGLFLGALGRPGSQKGQFMEPVWVAVDLSENIYVVDRGNSRVSKYDSSGTLLWEMGKAGTLDGEFREPANILVSRDSEVIVLDAGNARVQIFDQNGRFLRAFGNEGKGPGEFRFPAGLALEDGVRLVVGDRGNSRIQVFTLLQTPAVPSEVTALPRMNEVQLNWRPSAETTLQEYRIYRSDAPSGPFMLLAATTDPYYIDRGLPSNRSYHYRVSGRAREGNESALSGVASAVTPRLLPSAPKKVRIAAAEKEITVFWLPNREPFVDHYRVYRTTQLGSGFELVARTGRPLFTDGPMTDEALYYYQVTAVGIEGDESQPSEVVFATTPPAPPAAPPVEIVKIDMREIFASLYGYYESHPLGTIVLRNNTDAPSPPAMLTFSIKDFMDFPVEIAILEIGPRQELAVPISPVFSHRILEVTENATPRSEAGLTLYAGGEARTVKRSMPVTLYERHAVTWDRKETFGIFVTPMDPPVADFARTVVKQYADAYPNLPAPLVYARTLYEALGVYGMSYVVDPTSPFEVFSSRAGTVDYLQYPRDTLSRKSGDCDELSILYLAALESIGIETALVVAPGHVFVLVSTGVADSAKDTLGFPDDLLVRHRGTVWVPVEMTLVDASFSRAWQRGAEEYRAWSAKGKAEIIEVRKAWEQFRSVPLPPADARPVKVRREEIEAKYPDELEELGRGRLAMLSASYRAMLRAKPGDPDALARLGILYGENGMYIEALEQYQKLLAVDKDNAMALNNIGNIYFLQERLDDARQAYEASHRIEPDDAGTMVNLSRVQLRMGRKDDARNTFQSAVAVDPRVLRRYGELAAELKLTK